MRDINAILSSKFRQSVERRFKERFVALSPDECWEWTGLRGDSHYGLLSVSIGSGWWNEGAHRLAWVLHNGPLPDLPDHGRAHVLHHCDNPPCVNPKHLFVGTYGDNNRDKAAKGRAPRGETHPITHVTEEQVRSLRADPRPQRELARAYGLAETTVHNIKHGLSWAHIDGDLVPSVAGYKRGEESPGAKLTAEQVRAVRADRRTHRRIAADYGVSHYAIQRIKSGKTWNSLT